MATIVRALDLTPSGPPINVVLFEEFQSAWRNLFTVVYASPTYQFLRHDPDQLNLCDRSKERAALFPYSMGGCLVVSNEMELERLTQKLFRLPLFFSVDLQCIFKSGDTHHTYTCTAAVVVNSQHPQIQEHFKGLLNQAMEYMRQGKRFAVEFNFNGILEDWYREETVAAGIAPFHASFISKNGIITVTNYGEYSSWFACSNYPTVCLLWLFCFPCCMLTCPIYVIQRKLRVVDLGGRVRGVQATTFHEEINRDDMRQLLIAAVRSVNQHHMDEVMDATISEQPRSVIDQPPPYSTIE